jgi:RNA polymerase sigma factor (sigma-70 family)
MNVIAAAGVGQSEEASPDRTFEAIAVPDARRLYSLALSILRDEGEAEDAVQETLLKAWRSWNSVSTMDRPASWLTRVCVNHCISRRRHLRSRGWPPLALIEDAVSRGDANTAAEFVDMDRAYRRLSLRQRAAITLNYRHGYSVEECAVFMGCSPGSVRTHLARGLATLRRELGDD